MSRRDEPMYCGPFEVVEPVGAGGMGAVYRGEHRDDDTAVAIKVMTLDGATDPSYLRAFRREARALAQLNHPSIAEIYDFGRVSEETAEAGPVPFREGAPWFAMEFVEGTSVGKMAGVWTWSDLEEFLLSVLDALAHAHARNVLHRDLTASNILLKGDGGPGEIQVVDFGLARLVRSVDDVGGSEESSVRGTPRYMAPEQILGESREQGPWTDLYALGCLAWRIVCGTSPFRGENTRETFLAHFEGIHGDFDPQFAVPETFEPWVRGLIEQEPAERCRRAADAAWALLQMEEPPRDEQRDASAPATWEGGQMPTLATIRDVDTGGRVLESGVDDGYQPTVEESEPFPVEAAHSERAESSHETLDFSPPPVPAGWEREFETGERSPLSGAGLELFPLRRLPIVDRRAERDRLWHALCRVREELRPAAVLMVGPAGSGKTRLAEWLGERARELGAAEVVAATHERALGQKGGLSTALVRYFRCDGLGWGEAVERLTERLERLGIERQTGLSDAVGLLKRAGWSGPEDRPGPVAGFQTPRERDAALGRILRGLASRDRPLIVRLDDVARSRESVDFVRHALEDGTFEDVPILFVMTSRTAEWAASDPLQQLADAMPKESCRVVDVGPLAPEDQRELVRRMLRFDEEIVDAVAQRTEGHPLFAVQLVQSWVDAGALVESEGRFVLALEHRGELPDDLDRLWARRIAQYLERFASDRREEVERAVELGAVLGKQVDTEEWRAACRRAGLEVGGEVPRELMIAGLAEQTDRGWQFQHSMLAESLRSNAERAGRLAEHHRTCAETLEEVHGARLDETAERRAEHWIAAGERERALEPLLRAAQYYSKQRGNPGRAIDILERRRTLMDACGLSREDRRRTENRLALAKNAIAAGKPERAEVAVDGLDSVVEKNDWPGLRGDLELARARLAKDRGDFEGAQARIDVAEEAYRRAGDEAGRSRALRFRGAVGTTTESREETVDVLQRARDLAERIGDVANAMRAKKGIAWAWLESGEPERAAEIAKELIAEARDHRERTLEAHGFNLLAEIARRDEDWDRAIRLYERCYSIWQEVGSRYAAIANVNRALANAGAGRWERVEAILGELAETLPARGFLSRLIHVYVGLASCAAARGDWEEWEDRLGDLEGALEEYDLRLTDFAWMAERGAEACLDQGAPDRAARMFDIAARIWREVDHEDDAVEAERRATDCREGGSSRR